MLLNPSRFAILGVSGLDSLTSGMLRVYGIKRLLNSYTGPLVRIRRSSDNTELDIGYDGLGALDSSQATTFAGAGNAFVTTIYDQSGNAVNLVQATATKQPRIVNAGVYDGFVRFDGVDDTMSTSLPGGGSVFSIAQRYQLRAVGSVDQCLYGHANFNVAGHNTILYEEELAGGDSFKTFIFGGTSPNYFECQYTISAAARNEMIVWGTALASSARIAMYQGGTFTAQGSVLLNNTTASTYTAEAFYIGARSPGTTTFAGLNFTDMVIWNTDQRGNAATIAGVL